MKGIDTNMTRCKEFSVGETGYYEVTSGTTVRRLPAEVVNIKNARLFVKVLRGNGQLELKTISPRNFVRAS